MSTSPHMSQGETIIHAVLAVFTLGLWIPVYMARNKQIKRRVEREAAQLVREQREEIARLRAERGETPGR